MEAWKQIIANISFSPGKLGRSDNTNSNNSCSWFVEWLHVRISFHPHVKSVSQPGQKLLSQNYVQRWELTQILLLKWWRWASCWVLPTLNAVVPPLFCAGPPVKYACSLLEASWFSDLFKHIYVWSMWVNSHHSSSPHPTPTPYFVMKLLLLSVCCASFQYFTNTWLYMALAIQRTFILYINGKMLSVISYLLFPSRPFHVGKQGFVTMGF